MAKFKSKYAGLSFYVKGIRYDFHNGQFQTEDEEVIKVLEGMADVEKVVEQEEKEVTEVKQAKGKSTKKKDEK